MPDEIQKVSLTGLSAILGNGYLAMMEYFPAGDEPVIDLAVRDDGETIPIEVDDPHARLDLLADFAVAVRSLALSRTPEEIKRILANGVAQRIVGGDDSWAQEFLN